MSTIYRIREDLKTRIRERGLTIASVARAAGLSYACLSAMLNGRTSPTPRVKKAVAAALGERINTIFPSDCSMFRPELGTDSQEPGEMGQRSAATDGDG